MLERVFLRALVTALVTAVFLIPLLLGRRWLERRYAPQVRWRLWGCMAVLLLGGLFFQFRPAVVLERPGHAAERWTAVQGEPAPAAPERVEVPMAMTVPPQALPAQTAPLEPERELSAMTVLTWAWLAGAALVLAVQVFRHLLLRRRLMRASYPAEGMEAADGASFRRLPELESPMVLGLLRPVILLPEGACAPMAVRHELTHLQREDLWGKAVIFAACALYWFDPLVWLMAAQAAQDVEAACDAQVAREMDGAEKRAYGELLLAAAGGRMGSPFSTRFSGSKEQMKTRLTQLFHPGRRSWALVWAVVTAALLCSMAVGFRAKGVADGRYYALYEWVDQPRNSDFREVTFRLVDYVPEGEEVRRAWVEDDRVTLPIAEDVRLGEGESQEVWVFLALPGALDTVAPTGLHDNVLRLEVFGGQVTAMEWVRDGLPKKEGARRRAGPYGMDPEEVQWLELVQREHREMERLQSLALDPDLEISKPRWFTREELEMAGCWLSDREAGRTCYEVRNGPASMEELFDQAYKQFEPRLAESICSCARWGESLCFFAEGKMWHRDGYETLWTEYDWDSFRVVNGGEDFVTYTLEGYCNYDLSGKTSERRTWQFTLRLEDVGLGVKLWRYADTGMEIYNEAQDALPYEQWAAHHGRTHYDLSEPIEGPMEESN